MNEKVEKRTNWKATFFWGGYVILLSISIPHTAYVFAAYTDGSLFEWILCIAGASLIEASIYVASWSIYQLVRSGMNVKKFFANFFLYIWILICMITSWWANSIHNAHFQNNTMLSGTANIPYSDLFAYVSGAWPLFGIIFSFTSNIATKDYIDNGPITVDERTPEQIQLDADKQIARLRAEASIKNVRAELRGEQIRKNLKGTVGGTVAGAIEGVRDGLKQEKVEIQTPQVINQVTNQVTVTQEDDPQEDVQQLPQISETYETFDYQPSLDYDKEQKLIEQTLHEEVVLSDSQKLEIALNAYMNNNSVTADEIALLIHVERPAIASFWLSKAKVEAETRKMPSITVPLKANTTQTDTQPTMEPIAISGNGNTPGYAHEIEGTKEETKDEKKEEKRKRKEIIDDTPWEYKTVIGTEVGYSNSSPYFTTNRGLTFASLNTAYQKEPKENKPDTYGYGMRHKKINKENLRKLIENRELDPKFVRFVTVQKPFGKGQATAMTVAVHKDVRDILVSLL